MLTEVALQVLYGIALIFINAWSVALIPVNFIADITPVRDLILKVQPIFPVDVFANCIGAIVAFYGGQMLFGLMVYVVRLARG